MNAESFQNTRSAEYLDAATARAKEGKTPEGLPVIPLELKAMAVHATIATSLLHYPDAKQKIGDDFLMFAKTLCPELFFTKAGQAALKSSQALFMADLDDLRKGKA